MEVCLASLGCCNLFVLWNRIIAKVARSKLVVEGGPAGDKAVDRGFTELWRIPNLTNGLIMRTSQTTKGTPVEGIMADGGGKKRTRRRRVGRRQTGGMKYLNTSSRVTFMRLEDGRFVPKAALHPNLPPTATKD